MKKKKISLLALSVIAGLSVTTLASCGPDDNGGDAKGDVNVFINYKEQSGVSYRGATTYNNPVENLPYVKGDILPAWKALGELVGVNIKDASNYSGDTDDLAYTSVSSNNFIVDGKQVDLLMNTTKNMKDAQSKNLVEPVSDHLDDMPNYKAYLEANPAIRELIEIGGKVYYSPYFDGYNTIEKMFVMDTTMVERLLDTNNAGDTTAAKGEKTLKGNYFTPFIDSTNNYPSATTTVSVVKTSNGKQVAGTIDIAQTQNIIAQQNALLATEGTTGKDLVDQMKAYLNAAFGTNVGSDKLYKNYSEIFVGASAAYNTDELVALMRLVKANPSTATAGVTDKVEIAIPRGHDASRVGNIMQMATMFGIQGLTSEKDYLYFGADKKLHDARASEAAYEGLYLLNDLYNEGLIVGDYWQKLATQNKTYHLDKYWRANNSSITDGKDYAFLMYDYTATTVVANDEDAGGLGTQLSKRVIANQSRNGYMPVLSPLTYWQTTAANVDINQSLTDKTGKTLLRYSEDNRALKDGGWCVLKAAQNMDGAFQLMDAMFSTEGSRIQDFGPEAYWDGLTDDILVDTNGNPISVPKISAQTKGMLKASGDGWNDFYRKYIGATQGVGHVRSAALDYQVNNEAGQVGLNNVLTACTLGVMKLSQVTTNYDFGASVPTAYTAEVSATTAKGYEQLTSFWTAVTVDTKQNYNVIITADHKANWADYKTLNVTLSKGTAADLATIQALRASFKTIYVYTMANSLGSTYVPAYAVPATPAA